MTYTIEMLAAEQAELGLDRFDYDFAWSLGGTMHELAKNRRAPVAISVAHGPHVVFSLTLRRAQRPTTWDWTARKRAVAHRFHRSSLSMRFEAEAGGFDFNRRYLCLPESDFAASGGGVPLMQRNGTLMGTAGVSGLPDVEDHQLVVEALRIVLSRQATT